MRTATQSRVRTVANSSKKVDFNMVSGAPTIHIIQESDSMRGVLVTKSGKSELTAEDTSTLKASEASIIKAGLAILKNTGVDANTKIKIINAKNLKTCNMKWIRDESIIKILNDPKIELL